MRESTSRKGGVSLDDADAIETGLFSSGPARVKESIFADYDYGGNSKPVAVWLVTFEREGENDYEQPYSLGKGWKVSKDGLEIIPKMGQTGLPKSCNAMRHLVKPLKAALKAADLELDFTSGDPRVIEGLEVVLRRVEQEKRAFGEGGGKRRDGKDEKERSILEIEEVTGTSEGGKKKKKPARDDDDEKPRSAKKRGDDDDDEKPKARNKHDADEDESPRRGKKDADEDERPARRGGKKDEDADEADEETIREEGIEALIEVLQDGAVDYDDLEALVKKEVKGHKHAAEIVEWVMDTDNLELEKGWSYAKDKKTRTWTVELA